MAEAVEVIRSQALAGVPHGFLGRRGGVSEGVVAGLNVGHGAGDEEESVGENRRRAVAAVLPGAALATVYQIHSSDAVTVMRPWPHTERPRADAMATDRPGVLLGVVTADCAPVLLADTTAGVIGAAHAGWKGALTGVVEATIVAMEKLGARREQVRAAVGPCIGRESYEVGPEFPAPFLAQDEANGAFFRPARRAGHFMFDLAGYLTQRIGRAGVAVEATGHDTLAAPEDFFSYRRNTLQGVRDYGRGLSAIALGT